MTVKMCPRFRRPWITQGRFISASNSSGSRPAVISRQQHIFLASLFTRLVIAARISSRRCCWFLAVTGLEPDRDSKPSRRDRSLAAVSSSGNIFFPFGILLLLVAACAACPTRKQSDRRNKIPARRTRRIFEHRASESPRDALRIIPQILHCVCFRSDVPSEVGKFICSVPLERTSRPRKVLSCFPPLTTDWRSGRRRVSDILDTWLARFQDLYRSARAYFLRARSSGARIFALTFKMK